MSDITYAAIEIVHFMNPKIRTRHQRPKKYVVADAFYIWKAEVEKMYKVSNAKDVGRLHLHIFNR